MKVRKDRGRWVRDTCTYLRIMLEFLPWQLAERVVLVP